MGSIDGALIDRRSSMIGKDADFSIDNIQVRCIHWRALISVLIQGVVPFQISFRSVCRRYHKAMGIFFSSIHIRKAVLVVGLIARIGLRVTLPRIIVDDIVPAPGYTGTATLAQAFKNTGSDLIQRFPNIGGNTSSRTD